MPCLPKFAHFFDKNTRNRGKPQLLFSLNSKTLMFFIFNIYIYSKNFLWVNIKISPHSQPLYFDTSAKKAMCFSDKGVLKSILYQVLFKRSWGVCWYALHNTPLIINIFFAVASTHPCANTVLFLKEFCLCLLLLSCFVL